MPFSAYTPYYPIVGHCSVYFGQGFVRAFLEINGKSAPHFLILITHRIGVVR